MSNDVIFNEPRIRIRSIDTIRGVIMIIMALDHTREFFLNTAFTANPLAPDSTSLPLYFTRWITHYCAPSFMLLSGISAYLAGKNRSALETSSFLLKRGLWLIFVEVVIMTLILSFDITYKIIILNILWALGTSMLVVGLCVRFFSSKVILIIGLILIFGHNVLDYVKLTPNSVGDVLLAIFFTGAGKFIPVGGGRTIAFFYTILPWAGIMLSGYGIGSWYDKNFDTVKRKRLLAFSGLGAIILFFVLRYVNLYGDPAVWTQQKEGWRTMLSFMNVSKYPPSLMFTLMTLGPILILLSVSDSAYNAFTRFVSVYGKVPFFYFLTHFSLIHILSAIVVLSTGYSWEQATNSELFFKFRPTEFGYDLGWVYVVWILVVLVLYKPCQWFGNYKTANKKWWLSYL